MDKIYETIPDLYAGKSVFVTGGTGFLGKVLIEKLLYSCPELDKVYVLLRDKRGVSAEQRLKTMLQTDVFSRIRNEKNHTLDKIVLIKGNITAPNLDMKNEDIETLIEKVSVVIHGAASVKFSEPLKEAWNTNYEGTRNLINLCRNMKNFKVIVYISTAFSNFNIEVVEEVVYPPPASIEEINQFLEKDNESVTKLLNGLPNTYTLTKAMAENLVAETYGIPVVIIRPSIVGPSIKEPIQGWIDNWYGATGILTFMGKGICRVALTCDHCILDLIPVDYVCNLTLVAAARAKRSPVKVLNCCTSSSNPVTMKMVRKLFTEASVAQRFNVLPYPQFMLFTKNKWVVKTISGFMYCLAYFIDLLLRIGLKEPRFTKLVSQANMVRDRLDFFTSRSWLMKTDQTRALAESLSPQDAQLFPFHPREICWKNYMNIYLHGIVTYLLGNKA